MTSMMGEQLTLQDLDTLSMKMFPEHCPRTKEKTSVASSKRSHKSSKAMLAFLDLRGNGPTAEASSWTTDRLLGDYTMHSISESHNEGKESVCYVTSMDLRQVGFCLTLNLSEKPRVPNPTLLSDILEEDADPKYELSEKACRGILNRASKRGKQLPSVLKEALESQIRGATDGQTETTNS